MEKRVNQILLAATVVTAALYAFVMLCWVGLIPVADPDPWMVLGCYFHAVPCFFLQLLVCRAAKQPLLRLIPVFLLAGFVAVCVGGLVNTEGLDGLGWILLLFLCAAPAAGYGLAWAAYGIGWAVRRGQRRAP